MLLWLLALGGRGLAMGGSCSCYCRCRDALTLFLLPSLLGSCLDRLRWCIVNPTLPVILLLLLWLLLPWLLLLLRLLYLFLWRLLLLLWLLLRLLCLLVRKLWLILTMMLMLLHGVRGEILPSWNPCLLSLALGHWVSMS